MCLNSWFPTRWRCFGSFRKCSPDGVESSLRSLGTYRESYDLTSLLVCPLCITLEVEMWTSQHPCLLLAVTPPCLHGFLVLWTYNPKATLPSVSWNFIMATGNEPKHIVNSQQGSQGSIVPDMGRSGIHTSDRISNVFPTLFDDFCFLVLFVSCALFPWAFIQYAQPEYCFLFKTHTCYCSHSSPAINNSPVCSLSSLISPSLPLIITILPVFMCLPFRRVHT